MRSKPESPVFEHDGLYIVEGNKDRRLVENGSNREPVFNGDEVRTISDLSADRDKIFLER